MRTPSAGRSSSGCHKPEHTASSAREPATRVENIVSFASRTNGGTNGETNASVSDPGHLLHQRYRDGALPGGPWNEVIATILAHRSVRAFLPDPVPDGTLERLVAAASSASTSSNLQTWSVVAVEDPARKARLPGCGAGTQPIVHCPPSSSLLA